MHRLQKLCFIDAHPKYYYVKLSNDKQRNGLGSALHKQCFLLIYQGQWKLNIMSKVSTKILQFMTIIMIKRRIVERICKLKLKILDIDCCTSIFTSAILYKVIQQQIDFLML